MTTASTRSGTGTYTDIDVANVFACFSAEYDMIRSTTGLERDDAAAAKLTDDVELMARYGLIAWVDVTLKDRYGRELRANVYTPSTSAALWKGQRPGDCIWPRTPDGSLLVTVVYSAAYAALDGSGRQALQRLLSLRWPSSSRDLTHSGLTAGATRTFASAAYGVERRSLA